MPLLSSLKRRLHRTFQIHEGEGGRLLLLFLLYFLVIGGIMVGRNARDSLFLQDFGRQYLAYMYIANAVFVVLCAVVYNLFIDRVNRFVFVAAANGLFAVAIGASWWVLTFAPFRWFYPILYIVVQILWIVGMMQFWTMASDVFDTRQAKRLFPLVGMGGLVGMVVSGFAVPPLVSRIGTANLLLVYVALLVLSSLVAGLVRWATPAQPAPAPSGPPAPKLSQWQEFMAGLAYIRSSSLLLILGGLVLALNVVFNVVDFQFSVVMSQSFPSRDALTSYLAAFRGLGGFVALVVQLALTSRVIAWLGVGRSVLVHPGFLVLATAGMTIDFLLALPGWHGFATGFVSANVAKFGDHILLYTIQDSTYNLLFNPIPAEKRGRARGFIDGYLKPLGSGIAGLLLVVYVFLPVPTYLSGAAFAIALAWLALALLIRRSYVRSLMDNLASADVRVRSAAMRALGGMRGDADEAVLARIAAGDDAPMAAFALHRIAKAGHVGAVPVVLQATRHANPVIRDAAVECLSKLDGEHHLRLFKDYLTDPDADVRAEAIEALGRVGDLDDPQILVPFLRDPSPKIRAKTVVTLIEVGGIDGILSSAEALKRMLESRDPGERITAAKALGALHIKHFMPSLLTLLQDPDGQVRLAAVRAMGKIHDPRAIRPLVALIPDRYLGKHAVGSLVTIGRKADAGLIVALEQHSGDLRVALGLLEVLEKVPYRGAVDPLIPYLQAEHARLRAGALRVLHAGKLKDADRRRLRPAIIATLRLEVNELYWITYYQTVLGRLPQTVDMELLLEALGQQRRRLLDGIFLALGLLGQAESVQRIYSQLQGEDPRGRALAMEALETVLPLLQVDLPLLGALDDPGWEERLRLCQAMLKTEVLTPTQCLQRLMHHPYNWIRACAVFCLSHQPDARDLGEFLALTDDRDHLVRENAVVGLAMRGSEGLEKARSFLVSPYPEVQFTARAMLGRLHFED